jgi:uncharacterized protein (TIGR03437 family)
VTALFLASLAGAQTFDNSGNYLLQGTSYFRQVVWIVGDQTGTLSEAIAIYGTIMFDGLGNYTITNAAANDSSSSTLQTLTTKGSYYISSSGYGYLTHPFLSNNFVYGSASRGMFIGSSTESPYNDIFISAPLASPAPNNASFRGAYTMMDYDVADGVPTDTRVSQFQLNPDGNGNLGSVSLTGHIAGTGTKTITQNFSGLKYFFSNGGANVNFGGSLTATNLIAGTKYLYFAADGSFVFGGSPTGWDMIIGVPTSGTAPSFNGLYYQAGFFQDESTLAAGYAESSSYYGSLNANSGTLLEHEHLLNLFNNNPFDFTYNDTFALKPDNTYDDSIGTHYVFGSGGAVRIGVGNGPYLGLNVAIQPTFNLPTSSGPSIYPFGVVNAASSAPFTAGVAPGELITIYGTNLSSVTLANGSFPTLLGGVQVTVNGRQAPIYFVSPGQVSAVIPFGTVEQVASVQVNNNGITSNVVTSFVNSTAPGVFTKPSGGIGTVAALHADNSVVSSTNPAQIGETIAIYVTGLGAVTPAVGDGVPGPSNPLSSASNTITVTIGGQAATTTFVGLAPGLVGLYQINVQVPTGLTSGNAILSVLGPDFITAQATIPIQ